MIVKNEHGKKEELVMDDQSCLIVETLEMSTEMVSKCGSFCKFHKFEPSFENTKTFSCKYIPPFGYIPSSKELEHKVQILTAQARCIKA